MANTLTEDSILNIIRIYGTVLEEQLIQMLKLHPTKITRTIHKLWKKDLVKFGGPDDAYVLSKKASDMIDMLYVDCIWVMLEHTDKEEDIQAAYKGRDVIKLAYFSREKQSSYNFIYVSDEEDYKQIPHINNRFIEMTDEDMVESMKFIFVSESEEVLKGLPLEKFKFPSICMQVEFTEGRYKKPIVTTVKMN